jgi:hypothetical protein
MGKGRNENTETMGTIKGLIIRVVRTIRVTSAKVDRVIIATVSAAIVDSGLL